MYIYIYIYIFICIYTYITYGVMAGITERSCVALFPLWSLKKHFVRTDVNQQKHTQKNSKFKFDKKSC